MSIPIEDGPSDVVRKAITGRALRDSALENLAGVSEEELLRFKAGRADESVTRRLCPHLRLDADKLLALAKSYPDAPATPEGLTVLTLACPTPAWPDMTVNAYAIHAPGEPGCILVDTGSGTRELIDELRRRHLRPVAVALTHGHFDHLGGLESLRAAFGELPAYASPADTVPTARPAHAGSVITGAGITLTARATPGHSEGGLTWVATGLHAPVAFTGDAIFAGSVGGAPRRLDRALDSITREILTLPAGTILAPGHGPLTTVGTERDWNPFFA